MAGADRRRAVFQRPRTCVGRRQGSGVCGAGVEIDAARTGNRPCRPDGDAARRDWRGALAAVAAGVVVGAEEVDRHGVTEPFTGGRETGRLLRLNKASPFFRITRTG